MPEIAEAQALLAALAETDEVKSAEGQRRTPAASETAYGHAMMWSKGFAADETRVAFARAAELATNDSSFSERFAAAHGQWIVALLRGELSAARKLAFAMLQEAEDAGYRYGSQRRAFRPRRDQLLRRRVPRGTEPIRAGAFGLRSQGRQGGAERLGDYIGARRDVLSRDHNWQLGEVDRARELIDGVKAAGVRAWPFHLDGDPALPNFHPRFVAGRRSGSAASG